MTSSTQLLVIDPQNDFCDLPADWCPVDPLTSARIAPALPVAGAHADLQRVAALLDQAGHAIDDVAYTLDSHQHLDIAHPTFWQQGEGDAHPVDPFTQVTAAQVRDGRYRPRDPAALPRVLAYLDALESRGRYTLMVWPVHCEIGSWGHGVHAALRAAGNRWEERRQRNIVKVTKGENPWTEHYSAVMAEVPLDDDAHTRLNRSLVDWAARAGRLLVAGEASSHCVRATTEDLVAHLPAAQASRIVLLTDCMSPVAGFQAQHDAFLAGMRARGVRLATSAEVAADLARA